MTLDENEVIVGSPSGGIPLDIKDITVSANATTPVHDGASGDKISAVDALAVEQHLVGQLNAYFE